jgi:hypothetical protein
VQFLVYGIIVSTLSFGYFVSLGAPGWLAYCQELVAAAAAAVVVAAGVQQHFREIRAIYWLVFGALAVNLLCGLIVNTVDAGPTFAAVRTYLRAIPCFFLPAVIQFSEQQVRRQLLLILGFALAQLPIALHQRFTTFANGYFSGDRTFGTLMDSGHLSIFLIGVASVIFAFYVRERLRFMPMLLLLAVVVAPTMLNETKATIFLLPLALFVVGVVGASENRLRKAVLALATSAVFLAAFVPVYDYFVKPRWGYGIVEFFMMEDRVENYLESGAEVGSHRGVGRFDAVTIAFEVLSRDPSLVAFGLGAGNVSLSALGDQFTGEHFQRYGYFVESHASMLLWETGVLGLLLVLILFGIIWADASKLSRGSGFYPTLALGMMGVIAVFVASFPYTTITESGALSFLFWYLAGLIAAERTRALSRARLSVDVVGHRNRVGRGLGSTATS